MNVVLHHVCADLLHPPHVPLDAHRLSGERTVGGGKDDGQQAEHCAQTPQFVRSVHFGQCLTDRPRTFRPESQGIGRKGNTRQPVPQFGERLHAPLYQRMAESHHQITHASVLVRAAGRILPAMEHRRRNQRHVARRKGLQRIACHSAAPSVNDVIQLPRIVAVQLGFEARSHPLVDEEKRMILRFGQFVRYGGIFHKIRESTNIRQIYETIKQTQDNKAA